MKFENEPSENAPQMLTMAKSDLSVARAGKIANDTRYETLCTLCQQAMEKSLKSLMIHRNIPYPRDHSIEILITEMEKQQIILPEDIKASALAFVTIEGGFSFPLKCPMNFGTAIPLSEYAKDRRYSLSEKPLEEQDYKNVLARCEKIVEWVEKQIQT
jgi:HEPN domain-containing protein